MYLKELEIAGFKSFAKKSKLKFDAPISSIVGPNGSGKSNIAEAFRFVLGEQSIKSMRGKKGEDLIFNGTQNTSRQNRASVKVVFDNNDKKLPIDFDEVSIERVVNRDGSNEYYVNNSGVRLKDISELLASANIGSSGHHIISQGEADRILNATPKERRIMLEDALGLKIFQYKKIESLKKLEKTDLNLKQVESLRREIAPHIKFLKKQVEKIEAGKKLREELFGNYLEYLKRESVYLKNKKQELDDNIKEPRSRLSAVEEEIEKSRKEAENKTDQSLLSELKSLENERTAISSESNRLLMDKGRLEGEINSLEKIIANSTRHHNLNENKVITVSQNDLNSLEKQIDEIYSKSENLVDLGSLKNLIMNLVSEVKGFIKSRVTTEDKPDTTNYQAEIEQAKNKISDLDSEIEKVKNSEKEINEKIEVIRKRVEEDKTNSLEAEKNIINLLAEKNELQQKISTYAVTISNLQRDEDSFKQELTESAILVGREVLTYESLDLDTSEIMNEDREAQIKRRRDLERLKIRVEELGGGSGQEVEKEFQEVQERDEFLIKEIEDLEKSAMSLNDLIIDLDEKINTQFKEGTDKINKEFQNFFSLMFGGGEASLRIVKTEPRKRKDTDMILSDEDIEEIVEEEKSEEGIEISVNLPRKKIRDLMMLSGGERALTSIALLFAISQVNPPPFIILDETDAALDEANSKKYADMIENLSKYSQLILITHNRETMSRAGVIYGVTMIGGISQLLSIAFDEGIQYAK